MFAKDYFPVVFCSYTDIAFFSIALYLPSMSFSSVFKRTILILQSVSQIPTQDSRQWTDQPLKTSSLISSHTWTSPKLNAQSKISKLAGYKDPWKAPEGPKGFSPFTVAETNLTGRGATAFSVFKGENQLHPKHSGASAGAARAACMPGSVLINQSESSQWETSWKVTALKQACCCSAGNSMTRITYTPQRDSEKDLRRRKHMLGPWVQEAYHVSGPPSPTTGSPSPVAGDPLGA